MCRSWRVLAGSDQGLLAPGWLRGERLRSTKKWFPGPPRVPSCRTPCAPSQGPSHPLPASSAARSLVLVPPPPDRSPAGKPPRDIPEDPKDVPVAGAKGKKDQKPTGTTALVRPVPPGPVDNSGAAGAISRRLTPRLAPGLPLPSTPLPECIKGGLQPDQPRGRIY